MAVQLNRLLNLNEEEAVFTAEESLQDLLTLPVTREIMQSGLDADGCIEIRGLGTALHLTEPAEFWLLLTDRYSRDRILQGHVEGWEVTGHQTLQVGERDFFLALMEYFAKSMKDELFCESCSVPGESIWVEERIEHLQSFLGPIIPQGRDILEICCGGGMATQALERLGHRPYAMDSDRCDLCTGLKSGRMDPSRCFVLDARLLPHFFPSRSFDVVLGFMVGLIDASNWHLWKDILLKSSALAKEMLLYTVYSQKEAEIIAKTLDEAGWKGEVIDNRDSGGIYDKWAYLAMRE